VDPVRNALMLVADDVDRSRLGAPADIRARGERIRRRRRAIGAQLVALAVVVMVLAVWVGHGIPHAAPQPLQSPAPTPTPNLAQVQVVHGGCGHGLACPTGTGPFRVVLDSGRGGDQFSLELPLPPGWKMAESSGNGIRAVAPDGASGVSAVWPVRQASGSADALTMAEGLARLPGATAAAQSVDIGGRLGWRVAFSRAPSGSSPCVDPRFGLYLGERYGGFGTAEGLGCARLFELGFPTSSVSTATPVGLSGSGQVEVTLVDVRDLPTHGARSVLSLWHWGADLSADKSGQRLLAGMRIGAYADPYCGMQPPCAAPHGSYVVHGDPIVTGTGIRAWGSQVSLRLPAGWTVDGDDDRGDASLGDDVGRAGAELVWEPQLPGQPPTVLQDARAWALATAGRSGVVSGPPVHVRLGGATAWRVDASANGAAAAFRQSDYPYVDPGCGGNPPPYAIALACQPAAAAAEGGIYLEGNETARLWFVQVDATHVLLVEVWGKRLRRAQPPGLPAALAATASMLGSLTIR
jgi:hypothetical protein